MRDPAILWGVNGLSLNPLISAHVIWFVTDVEHPWNRSDAGSTKYESSRQDQSRKQMARDQSCIISFVEKGRELGPKLD